jgi:hypothetical protein
VGSPYQIATWTHLNNTRQNLDANFTLVAELNASTAGYDTVASASANGDKGFEPIGEGNSPFTGTVDGNGYTISNLHIDRSGSSRVGLFSTVREARLSISGSKMSMYPDTRQ